MVIKKSVLVLCCVSVLALSGCSRQQSDWQKARESNTADAYEQFLKKYPSGEFTAQAQARAKELYEERDWQKARDADTPEAYQAFLKQYPEGKWTEEARIRLENFTLAQTPSGSAATQGGSTVGSSGTPAAASADAGASAKSPSASPATAPAKPAPPAAIRKQAAGTAANAYGIQLGAFKSGAAAANQKWARLQKEYPKLLAGLSSKIVPKKTATGTLYRLQAAGVSEKQARTICKSLKARSEACVVIPPAQA